MLNRLICLYLVLLLLRPQEFVPSLRGLPILQVILASATIVWVFDARKDLRQPQMKLALWFLLSAMLGRGLAGWWGGSLLLLDYLLPVLLLFAVLSTAAQELADLRRVMFTILVCACVMVLHGHFQKQSGVGWTGLPTTLGRITYSGIFSDPNDLGQLFSIAIVFTVYFARGSGFLSTNALLLAGAWLGYGIYLTDSRGTMLATLAALGYLGLKRLGKISTAVIVLVGVVVLLEFTRLSQVSSQEESAAGRVEAWYEGTQMFLHNPLFGVGFGNFTNYNRITAHNFIVLGMAEQGMMGFIPWFGILLFSVIMLRRLLRRHATTPGEADEHAAVQSLVAMSLAIGVSSFFLSQTYKHALFIGAALVVARYSSAARQDAALPRDSVIGKMPLLLGAAVTAIFSMWLATRILLR